jgi:imidazole glycerol-phosphate synthase subunit HisH
LFWKGASMLAVIDYGAGNLRSVIHALNHLHAPDVVIVQQPEQLAGADKIILPGVGAFGAGMQILRERGLADAIRAQVAGGTPYLGICLGMQFLFETSDEMGTHEGLGILPGSVTRFENRPGLKVPHMGWNRLTIERPSPVLEGLSTDAFAYFVHSYYCVPTDPAITTATVEYGDPFCVAVQREHVYGVQFHPEKSQRTGLRILTNFLNLPGKAAA